MAARHPVAALREVGRVASGRVTKVLTQGTTFSGLNDCLKASVKRWQLPRSQVGGEFAFPLRYPTN
jgi:hypothetical protein